MLNIFLAYQISFNTMNEGSLRHEENITALPPLLSTNSKIVNRKGKNKIIDLKQAQGGRKDGQKSAFEAAACMLIV